MKKTLALFTLCMLLSACAHTHIDVATQVALPAQFEHADHTQTATEVGAWWQQWPDPYLQQLIEQGLEHNHNLAALRANLASARANAALARADVGPNAALVGGVGAHDIRLDNPLSDVAMPGGGSVADALTAMGAPMGAQRQHAQGNQYHMGFAASWEPDVFGGKRSDADAAEHAALGVAEQWHGAQLMLAADIADNYIQIRALQQRLRIGQSSVATLRQLQRYAQGRFRAGHVTDYDVQEVAAKLSTLQAQQATWQAQIDAYQRNLAVLIGQTPQSFVLAPSSVDVLNTLPAAPAGVLPVDVLNRRPDVRAQASKVRAMSAKLASAKADLLPRFDLQFVWQSGRIRLDSDVPAMKGLGGLVSAGVTLPLFTAGRIQRNIEGADARLQAALAEYDSSILKALAEVDSSYQLQYSLQQQSDWLAQAQRQVQRQATGSDKLFRLGKLTLDRSLAAHLNAQDVTDKHIQSQLATAQNMLNLYKALGGGWQAEAEIEPVAP